MTDVPLSSCWADLHPSPSRRGRTFRVDRITLLAGRPVAICTVLTKADGSVTDEAGGRITILVKEFTGDRYKRIEVEEEP